MIASPSLPTLRLILAGSFVIVLLATIVAWDARGPATGWALAGAFLALASTAWWVVSHYSAAVRAQHSLIEQHEARWKEIPITQERFVNNLAHEIRTPLSIVMNKAELILGHSDDPAVVRDNARSIADYVLHFAALCDGFLRLEGPFVQGDTSRHLAVDIHDTVLGAVRRSQSTAHSYGVRVVTTLAESGDDDAPLEVLGDPVLLEAMIESLLRNAVRSAGRGTQVELRVSVRAAAIVVQVRDHGAGIAAAQLACAFDWFYQADGEARQARGPGVGLAIARRIIEHHRGTISLRNHPEGGCEFEVSLPLCGAEGQPTEQLAPAIAAVDQPSEPRSGVRRVPS